MKIAAYIFMLQLNSVDTLLSFYVSWYNTQSDTILRAGDFSNTDSTTLAALDSFASQQNEFLNGTQMARNFMNVYNKNYFTEAQLPDAEPEARRAQPESEPQIVKEEALRIKVYPNPYHTFPFEESPEGKPRAERGLCVIITHHSFLTGRCHTYLALNEAHKKICCEYWGKRSFIFEGIGIVYHK